MNQLIDGAIIGALLLSLVGCGTFSAKPDPSRFFTLSTLPQLEEPASKSSGVSAGISLGIGPISLPGYLDRQEIVTRAAPNRIDVAENDRWAEPLEANFARTLSQNLGALLQTERLVFFPWESTKKPSYQVEIEVLRFESNGAGAVQLSARWAVSDLNKKTSLSKESRLSRPIQSTSTEAAVAALSQALGDLSREIGDAVKNIYGQSK